jgi:beta-lactamase regulating signal transducer with metallopeptidase domain
MLPMIVEAAVRSLVVGMTVGLGLLVFRVRNVRLERAAWTTVLAAALLMPVLMQAPLFRIPSGRLLASRTAVKIAVLAPSGLVRAQPGESVTTQLASRPVPWTALATAAYLSVGGILLARWLLGLWLALRMRRRATPLREDWTAGADVRVSSSIGMPVTIGNTILLPQDFSGWDFHKRRAVMAHEQSHVADGDWALLALASLHRAIFWMNPVSWWLPRRLAELTEAISDDAALREAPDRPWYAELLVDLAEQMGHMPTSVAMARPRTIGRRVERILSRASLPMVFDRRRLVLLLIGVTPIVLFVAGCTLIQPAASARPAAAANEASQDTYAVVSGDSVSMSGSNDDAERARQLRSKLGSEYIWFLRHDKAYVVTDPAVVRRAKELFKPQEELGQRQAELGERQAKLGEQQAKLGELQAQVTVPMPRPEVLDRLQEEVQKLRAQLKATRTEISDELSELQARIGEMQREFGEAQSKAGEKQAVLGEQQAKLGEMQSKLGEQQSKLGDAQSRLGEEAQRKMRTLLDEAIRTGAARRIE